MISDLANTKVRCIGVYANAPADSDIDAVLEGITVTDEIINI
jgi:hypothetical protein